METKQEIETKVDALTGDKILGGHDYDGIQELDNRLPKWWLWLFYITIIFSVVYLVRYHVLQTAPLQAQEYENEIEAAKEKYVVPASQLIDASNVTMLEDESSLAAGKEIYDKNCTVCHLSKGEGLVGPNFCDNYWIHGGSIGDLFRIIVTGVPDKGMISWKDQLTPLQIQQVSSYILTFQGTNPPNQKEPQGELYEPGS